MHLLPADIRSLDASEAAIDLGQAPGAIVFASLTDSDLALAAASGLESLRIAPLQKLRHPMSVDLYIENTARHARAIVGVAAARRHGLLALWRRGIVFCRPQPRHRPGTDPRRRQTGWPAGGAVHGAGRSAGQAGTLLARGRAGKCQGVAAVCCKAGRDRSG